jgi:hypothetical protein
MPDVSVELIRACSLIQTSSDWTQSKILDVVGRYSLADEVLGTSAFPYIGVVCNDTIPNEARSHEKYWLSNEKKKS